MVECYYCQKRKLATECKTKVQNKVKGTFQNFIFKDFKQANTSSTQQITSKIHLSVVHEIRDTQIQDP